MIARILARIGAWLGAPTLDDYTAASPGAAMPVRHLNGVPWHAAPVPPRDHTCWVQTSGWIGTTRYVRCACGAVNRNPCSCCEPAWTGRNRRARNTATS